MDQQREATLAFTLICLNMLVFEEEEVGAACFHSGGTRCFGLLNVSPHVCVCVRVLSLASLTQLLGEPVGKRRHFLLLTQRSVATKSRVARNLIVMLGYVR